MIDPEIAICAAVLASNGVPFRCRRHTHGFASINMSGLEPVHGKEAQGFITSRGRFVDRREAMRLQLAAGIESANAGGYRGDELYSEDLY